MVVAVEASNFLADIRVIQALQVLLFMLTTCASSGSHRRLYYGFLMMKLVTSYEHYGLSSIPRNFVFQSFWCRLPIHYRVVLMTVA